MLGPPLDYLKRMVARGGDGIQENLGCVSLSLSLIMDIPIPIPGFVISSVYNNVALHALLRRYDAEANPTEAYKQAKAAAKL